MKNATQLLTASIGAIMGLGGIEHGVGEILQGNTAPGGLVIQSWPDAEFFRIVGGEPAMTIIPNLLVAGILTILCSLAFLAWATLFIQRKNGGLVLILLSILMLLVGGGFAPPILGIVLGAAATRIRTPFSWFRAHLSPGLHSLARKLWPGAYIACIAAWLLLFPGTSILAYFFGMDNPSLVPMFFTCAFGLLLVTFFTGFVSDSST